jgi:hypothetical protein
MHGWKIMYLNIALVAFTDLRGYRPILLMPASAGISIFR